ncbi:hypothetical protein TCAL_17435 [Tigriopus californicus]|uniref:Uncharacterized protein n=1 Tax=Tigriopus californicus TaxID=6832 RepID=A0A553PJI0_TIGCA|nr:hypothetical protein TCAL_17435 [Tigriopus californicus]
MVVPVYAPEIQTKIIELYELLKPELEEGDEITNVIEPMEPQINEISRKKRSAEASPFFFGYGRRRSYGHGYNRGYRRSYGRRYYH